MTDYKPKKQFKRYTKPEGKPSANDPESITFDWKPDKVGDASDFVRKQEKLKGIIELKFKNFGVMISKFQHAEFNEPAAPSVDEASHDADPLQIKMNNYNSRMRIHWKKVEDYAENYRSVWEFLW